MPNPATVTAAPAAAAARPPDRMRAWLERETRLALATRTLRAQLADPDPQTWLRATPLMRALTDRARNR